MKLWHIAALVIAGLVVGELAPGRLTEPFRALTLYVFLPALVFEAAWSLDLSVMRRHWRPIVLLAVPGVAVTATVVAAIVHFAGGVDLASAIVIGAVLSATDPIAVVAVFRRLRVPRALATIVESESLLNDAVAIVLYRSVLAAIAAGAAAGSIGGVALSAVADSIGGLGIGVAIGAVAALVLRGQSGLWLQSAVTFAAAYLAYALTERIGFSGIFAVIACAVAIREIDRQDEDVVIAGGVERVWHVAGTSANVVLFFLIGAAVEVGDLATQWRAVLATLLAVFIARAILAYGLLAFAPRMERSWKTLVRLAGIRGALSLALALAVPGLVDRNRVIDAAFAVVIGSIVSSALTLDRRVTLLDLGDLSS